MPRNWGLDDDEEDKGKPPASKPAKPAARDWGLGDDPPAGMGDTPKIVMKPAPATRQTQGASPAQPATQAGPYSEGGDAAAAVGRGIINGIPIAGPYLLSGVERAAAGVRALQNGTTYPEELANVRAFSGATEANHPVATAIGNVGGGFAGFGGLGAIPAGATALGLTGANLLTRSVAGGATNALIGGADAAVRGENPLMGAAVGGAVGGAAPGVGYVGGMVGSGLKAAVEPFTAGGREAIANRLIGKFAAGGPVGINDNMLVQGSVPTLAQATGNPGLATLERGVRDVRPNPFIERSQANSAAREEAFNAVRGDTNSLESLIAQRSAAADPLRDAALANAGRADSKPVVKVIDDILASPAGQRDAVVKHLTAIRDKLVENIPGENGAIAAKIYQSNAAQLDGIRQAIGDRLATTGPKGESDARLASSQLMAVKNAITAQIEDAAPGYRKYLSTFSENSKPIDTQTYLQGLNLTNSQGNITLGNVDRAIKSIEKAQAAGGANAAKSIPDDVMGKLQAIRADLQREGNSSLGKSIGSNTFQNLATNNIAAGAGLPLAALNLGAGGNPLVSLATYGLKKAYGAKNDAIMDALVNRLLTPQMPASPVISGSVGRPGLAPVLLPGMVTPNRNLLLEYAGAKR